MLIIAVVICGMGVLQIYSAARDTVWDDAWWKQTLWVLAGLFLMWIMAQVDYHSLLGQAFLFYFLSLISLVAVLFVGTTVFGGRRWIGYGGFRFQISEFVKTVIILLVARYLTELKTERVEGRDLLKLGALVASLMLLVMKQPDLGTSLAFVAVVLTMLYWAGLPILYLFFLVTPLINVALTFFMPVWLAFLAALAIILYRSRIRLLPLLLVLGVNLVVGIATPQIWNHLQPYQKQRITTFLDPSADAYGAGYQIIQSKIAIGSGQILGKGFLHGTQKALAFLPEQHTDFIYSVVGEETGFLGSVFIAALYLVLILRGILVAHRSRSRFGGLLAIGMTAIFLYHVLVNIWMTVGLAPVTGLPLPLLSYGGSAVISTLAAFGLILNVRMRRFTN